jgi:hypothetical protein
LLGLLANQIVCDSALTKVKSRYPAGAGLGRDVLAWPEGGDEDDFVCVGVVGTFADGVGAADESGNTGADGDIDAGGVITSAPVVVVCTETPAADLAAGVGDRPSTKAITTPTTASTPTPPIHRMRPEVRRRRRSIATSVDHLLGRDLLPSHRSRSPL